MSELSLLHSQFLHLAQWIKLKLDNGEEIEGQIFTYDKINIPGTASKYNFRIIKINYIKENSIPSNKNDNTKNTSTSNDISSTPDSNKIDDKAQVNNKSKKDNKNKNPNGPYSNSLSTLVPFSLKEEFQSQNRIGIGVTEEAQQIFEILVKQ
ncbi:hypothetical protein U3516DRAFT_767667 [Neocallimastix sp. 'constans']